MPTFKFEKLVRRKLPAMYKQLNQKITSRQLSDKEFLYALRAKLAEEADEIPIESGDTQKIIQELSDVQQVIEDIKQRLDISSEEIEKARQDKLDKKGNFSDGTFVETISLDESDEWVKYYRNEPSKYPELRENGKVDPDLPLLERGTYRHTKSGQLYELVGLTFHTETYELLVIYQPLYKSRYELFARPYDVFVGSVKVDGETKPRFEKIDD